MLVDATDIARMLGASRPQVVHLAATRPDFPAAAVASDGARRRWERVAVERWAARQIDVQWGWRRPRVWAPGDLTRRTHELFDLAAGEATRMHHDFIGDLHVLLALAHPDCRGAAPRVLAACGLRLAELRAAVAKKLGRPLEPSRRGLLLDRQTGRLLEQAKSIAIALRDEQVSSEHVLLALTEAAPRSTAAALLAEREIDRGELMQRVFALTECGPSVARPPGDAVAQDSVDAADAARALCVSRGRPARTRCVTRFSAVRR